MAVNPQITKSYASNEKEYMISLVMRSSKFSFYLLFIIALPVLIEVNQILKLWLKLVPDYTPSFTILSIVIILITSVSSPLNIAIQATGKIEVYQAVVGVLLISILPLSYTLLKLGYPPEITYYVTISIEITTLVFRLFFLRKLINFPVIRFAKEVILKNILIVLLSISFPLMLLNIMYENITRLITLVFLSLTWSIVIIYFIGLNKFEKAGTIKMIKNHLFNI